jgi:hypothetical protein
VWAWQPPVITGDDSQAVLPGVALGPRHGAGALKVHMEGKPQPPQYLELEGTARLLGPAGAVAMPQLFGTQGPSRVRVYEQLFNRA